MRFKHLLNEITRPSTRQEADAILRDNGYHRVGKGSFASVYWKDGQNYVLKLFSSKDQAYLDFLTLVKNNPNKHFPKFYGKPVRVSDGYYAVRMEKLEPSYSEADFYNFATYVSIRAQYPDRKDLLQSDTIQNALEELSYAPDLKQALELVADNLGQWKIDMGRDNFMRRGDTLVITDPVSSITPNSTIDRDDLGNWHDQYEYQPKRDDEFTQADHDLLSRLYGDLT